MTPEINRFRELKKLSENLRNFHNEFEENYSGSKYDKKGYGFKSAPSNLTSFAISANICFDSWAGTYGNSSVCRVLSLHDPDNEIKSAFLYALNKCNLQKQIFAEMAEYFDLQSNELKKSVTSQIEELSSMLEDNK